MVRLLRRGVKKQDKVRAPRFLAKTPGAGHAQHNLAHTLCADRTAGGAGGDSAAHHCHGAKAVLDGHATLTRRYVDEALR